ncbi:hypothetical protein BCR44DRAFT_255357 [Catenaria anguillulae PL171]|uniref:DDE-1 domain-containing protein n=1 Tax=Catenaria anguillulae PL171 TaxID=765915 RepID=A0A1Y2HAX3_9FUNG|nr:hypothetical protein BCR44DRAFT_255357 [Catenaria anguillulae PL171]
MGSAFPTLWALASWDVAAAAAAPQPAASSQPAPTPTVSASNPLSSSTTPQVPTPHGTAHDAPALSTLPAQLATSAVAPASTVRLDHLRSYSSLTPSVARLLTNGASGHVPIAGGQASQQQQQQQQRRKRMEQLTMCCMHFIAMVHASNVLHHKCVRLHEDDFARLQLHASLPALATSLPATATSSADGQFLAWLQSTTFTSVSSVGDLFACLDEHQVRSLSPPMVEFFVSALNKSRAWRKAKGNSSHPPRAIVLVDADNRHGSPELVDALDKSPWLDVYAHGLAGEYRKVRDLNMFISIHPCVHPLPLVNSNQWLTYIFKWTASKLVEYTPAFRSMTEETDMDMVIRAFLPENVAKLKAATAVVIVSSDNRFGVLQVELWVEVACTVQA